MIQKPVSELSPGDVLLVEKRQLHVVSIINGDIPGTKHIKWFDEDTGEENFSTVLPTEIFMVLPPGQLH